MTFSIVGRRAWSLGLTATALHAPLLVARPALAAPCDPPITNPIACENTKPGNPPASGLSAAPAAQPSRGSPPTSASTNKSSANTGTHVGHLWTDSGMLLASATFTGETASGWQQVNLASPVAVTAGITYVASYHTDVGYYSVDEDYFATSGVDNGPLHALANGVACGNGVYAYGPSAFPADSWRSSSYWVDVLFAATSP